MARTTIAIASGNRGIHEMHDVDNFRRAAIDRHSQIATWWIGANGSAESRSLLARSNWRR